MTRRTGLLTLQVLMLTWTGKSAARCSYSCREAFFCLQPPIYMNVSTGILSVNCVSFMSEFYSQNNVYCLRHTEELATSARYPVWITFQILLRKDLLRSFFHYSTASLKPHLRIRDHQNFTNDQLLLLMKVYDQNV